MAILIIMVINTIILIIIILIITMIINQVHIAIINKITITTTITTNNANNNTKANTNPHTISDERRPRKAPSRSATTDLLQFPFPSHGIITFVLAGVFLLDNDANTLHLPLTLCPSLRVFLMSWSINSIG